MVRHRRLSTALFCERGAAAWLLRGVHFFKASFAAPTVFRALPEARFIVPSARIFESPVISRQPLSSCRTCSWRRL
jgi:hypothetical protein